MDPCSAARCVPACPVPRVACRFGVNVKKKTKTAHLRSHAKKSRDDRPRRKQTVASLFERYRGTPEFRLVNLSDVNQRGMTGDSLLHAAVIRRASEDVDILIAASGGCETTT